MASVSEVLKEKGNKVMGVSPTATVYEAIEQMVEHNCGSLLVMEDDDIAGIFTERDYLRKITLQGRTAKTTAVQEVMSSPVVVVESTAEIDEALAMMTDRHIRHLPVVDGRQVVGVVSIGDLVKHKTKEQEFRIGYLEDYIGAR
ncbi:MAG: CBS domain-containing protein [Acidimicrobiia bacterium]|nr:CBS domain-containing protein [Acidimicrobiia bacterium]MDH3398569.1 CBS domain-containing protein [Acidimicrobiia bacterium]MDH5615925.1 CBS domain-containing protein [Acidimicrobiia bacterium]